MAPLSYVAKLRLGVAAAAVLALFVGCERRPEPVMAGSVSRSSLQTLTIACSRVTDGQHTWLELEIDMEGRDPQRMPVIFKQGGRPVEVTEDQAQSLVGGWMKARADEIAIFGTIGMSFGQTTPAVTIDLDHPSGGSS